MNKILCVLSSLSILMACNTNLPTDYKHTDNEVDIFPDYQNITIPCNIAPLNFRINDTANHFIINIKADNGFCLTQKSNDGKFIWKERQWRKALKGSNLLTYNIIAQNSNGEYSAFAPFTQSISSDSIDSYLAYRLINTGYVFWEKLGIYQRCLENFEQTPIIESPAVDKACINCHTFSANSPETMMLHTRQYNGGTTILYDGKLQKFDTKTDISMSAGVYSQWNPNGYLLAMSTNFIYQQFFGAGDDRIYVSDKNSDIVLLNMKTKTLTTCPQLSTENLENLPAWAPDGHTLYYIATTKRDKYPPTIDMPDWYNLMRITYDVETNTWGNADTILRAKDVGGSITFPKVSACGNFIAFAVVDRGYFGIQNKQSDIYLLNLRTMQVTKPEINSDFAESNHAWSSTGRWLVVGSKRIDGTFTRPYFAHFDGDGHFSKPFVLPQKNPDFYNDFLMNYNNSDFIKDKVKTSQTDWRNAIRGKAEHIKADASVSVDGLSGATMGK